MGYRKFSERRQEDHLTLGALGGLGGQHSQNSTCEIETTTAEISTLTPPKASKAPKVASIVEIDAESLAGLAADTWTDAEEERAAIVEYDAGVPRAWAEGFARLDPSKPPSGIMPEYWLRFVDDCGRFLDGWAERAAALGWGPLHLFGCDRKRPFTRLYHLGLVWQVNGGRVVELQCNRATIKTRDARLLAYRVRPLEVGSVVLAWELNP
jgi:hypothetical protein